MNQITKQTKERTKAKYFYSDETGEGLAYASQEYAYIDWASCWNDEANQNKKSVIISYILYQLPDTTDILDGDMPSNIDDCEVIEDTTIEIHPDLFDRCGKSDDGGHVWKELSTIGHGGGVITKHECVDCGLIETYDSWASDNNGCQGYTVYQYDDRNVEPNYMEW